MQEGLRPRDTRGQDSYNLYGRCPQCVTIRTQVQVLVVGIEVHKDSPCLVCEFNQEEKVQILLTSLFISRDFSSDFSESTVGLKFNFCNSFLHPDVLLMNHFSILSLKQSLQPVELCHITLGEVWPSLKGWVPILTAR